MEVLKNNFNKISSYTTKINVKPYPRILVCDGCQSELQYEESDMRMGEYGCMHVDCPLCGTENMLEENEKNITLTKDNIAFPMHFHHASKDTGAVDVCNDEMVKKYIKEAINYFRNNKEEYDYGGWISDNFYINIQKYSDDKEYVVTVSNDFYEANIPFEKEDY